MSAEMSYGVNNNVNFRGRDEQQRGSYTPAIVGASTIAAGTTGLLLGKVYPPEQLTADTFEKTFEKVKDPAKKPIVTRIGELIKSMTKEKVDTKVKADIKHTLGDAESIPVKDFLDKIGEKQEGITHEVEGAKAKTTELTTALDNAKEALSKAEEVKKPELQIAVDTAKEALDNHLSRVDVVTRTKALVDTAKEGPISKAALEEHFSKTIISDVKGVIAKEIEALGKDAPRTISWRRGGIYAAIAGAGALALCALVGGGQKPDNT